MIKEDLIGIIHELKDVSDKLGLEISNEVIFSEASSFLRGIYAGQNKNKIINKESQKPTEKQIKFLKRQNIEIPATKQEAFNLIKSTIEKNG
ncbi:MAG: hypothetical protein ACTSW3_06150 [Promethearchaeota archaeon]